MLRERKGSATTNSGPAAQREAWPRAWRDGPATAQTGRPARDGGFFRKNPKLLDINMTTMRTIPTDNGFATQPPNYPVFTTDGPRCHRARRRGLGRHCMAKPAN